MAAMAASLANIVGVLLAAGSGSRFGGDKLLHPLPDGVALAAHAARNLIAGGLNVTAVVRPGDFPLADMLEQEGCHVIVCPDAAQGMGASLAHAIRTERHADGWVVALADMPRIRPATIRCITEAIADGAGIAAPRFNGTRGHPVGFAARFGNELATLTGDSGARSLLERQRETILLVDCDDSGVLLDIDRRADLER
jgi:molybdenum cofactor cytidylyltransferase